jgi:hypothetical protein
MAAGALSRARPSPGLDGTCRGPDPSQVFATDCCKVKEGSLGTLRDREHPLTAVLVLVGKLGFHPLETAFELLLVEQLKW